MGECANICENSLLSYRVTVNAALGTSVSFLPLFTLRSVKTKRLCSETIQTKVKTAHG